MTQLIKDGMEIYNMNCIAKSNNIKMFSLNLFGLQFDGELEKLQNEPQIKKIIDEFEKNNIPVILSKKKNNKHSSLLIDGCLKMYTYNADLLEQLFQEIIVYSNRLNFDPDQNNFTNTNEFSTESFDDEFDMITTKNETSEFKTSFNSIDDQNDDFNILNENKEVENLDSSNTTNSNDDLDNKIMAIILEAQNQGQHELLLSTKVLNQLGVKTRRSIEDRLKSVCESLDVKYNPQGYISL